MERFYTSRFSRVRDNNTKHYSTHYYESILLITISFLIAI